jgi:hypothetical protein
MQQSERSRSIQFEPLARVLIKDGVYLVVSLRDDGRISIAQQVEAIVGGKMCHFYLKNAIEVEPSTLITIGETIQAAIARLFELEAAAQ